MGSTRRTFTEEYKDQAVAFVIEGNRSVADVARNPTTWATHSTREWGRCLALMALTETAQSCSSKVPTLSGRQGSG